MKINLGEHVSIVGITGSGKTFFSREGLLPSFSRVLVMDSEDFDFDDYPAVNDYGLKSLLKGNKGWHVRKLLDTPEDADRLSGMVLKYGHDMAVYWDEITDFSTPSTIPPNLLKLIRKARKRNITVIVATQRPQLLNKSFLANSAHRIYFAISDYDVRHIKDYAPFLADRLNEIPWGSYRSLYQAPSGELTLLEPVRGGEK